MFFLLGQKEPKSQDANILLPTLKTFKRKCITTTFTKGFIHAHARQYLSYA